MSSPHGWPSAPVPGSAFARGLPAPIHVEDERWMRGWLDPGERTRVLAWLNEGLRPGRPGRLEREYPLLFSPDSKSIPITCFEGAHPVAFCILWPTRFELVRGALGTGLISLVFTDPNQRGRGLARRVVRRAVAEARAQALGLCLLWSDPSLADFYLSQGFTRAGSETLLEIDRGAVSSALDLAADTSTRCAEPLSVGKAREADWPSILALRTHRACHVAIEDKARTWLGIPDLEIRVARGPRGVVGFAMRGRGDDFERVIHEWGGEPEAVLRCCASLLCDEAGDGGLLLLAPRESCPLTWRLRSAGARVVRNPLAWFKVACAEAHGRDLVSIMPELADLSLSDIEGADGGAPRLHVANRTTAVEVELDAEDWLVSLFGDSSAATTERARTRASGVLPETAKSKLPLPLFVWGLESI